MSPRLAGAVLALIAAALLAMSIVTSAWWEGHPSVEGRTIDAKTVHIGLHGAEGCNTGGDGGCTTLELPDAFTLTGYVGAGAAGLLALAVVLMGILTLQLAEARKKLSIAVFVLAAIAVLVAAALIAQGPKVGKASQHIVIPMGYGLYLFAGGIVTAILAGVLARRPAPKVELRPSRAAIAPALSAPPPPQQQQPVDVLAFLQPEPPVPQVMLPMSPPTPVPRANISAMTGIPTPPPVEPPRPKPVSVAPPPPRTNPPAPPAPPPRTKPVSVPPLPIAAAFGTPEPPRTNPISVPPPPGARTRAGTAPPPPGAIAARLKASSVPPPVRPGALPKPPDPTALPMATPTTPKTLAGAVAPSPKSAPKLPVRAETDPSELAETVDRDSQSVGDATDANVVLPPESEHTSPSEPLDTEEGPAVRPPADTDAVATVAVPKEDPPRAASQAETAAVEKVEAEVARQSMSEIATVARERISSRELMTGDSTSETATPVAEAPKIPITTASSSLPPPKEKQVATSGPSPACPQCEAPMAWVEEHLRFYCKSCRMYF